MDRLISVDTDKLPKWMQTFGPMHFNIAPVGWKECDFQTYAMRYRMYRAEYTDSRQIHEDADGNRFPDMIQCQLYFYSDGTGVAQEIAYLWNEKTSKYEYTPRYYQFGCDHDYSAKMTPEEIRKAGAGYAMMHARKCIKCNHIDVWDTSD